MSLTCRLSSRMRVIQRCARTSPSISLRVRTIEPSNARGFLVNSQLSLRPAFPTRPSHPQLRRFSEKAASETEGSEAATSSSEESANAEETHEENDDEMIRQLKTQLEEAEKQAKEFKN